MSLAEKVVSWLKNASPQEQNQFMSQLQAEKQLFDALREAGLSPATEDPQARSMVRSGGVLSKINKIDLIDLITEIAHITLIDEITKIGEITHIKDAPFYRENIIANYGFETGDLTGWVPKNGLPIVMSDGGGLSSTGFYVCRLIRSASPAQHDEIGQALSRAVRSADVDLFQVSARTPTGSWILYFYVYYTDGTFSTHELTFTEAYQTLDVVPTAGKVIGGISAKAKDFGATIYVDEIDLIVAEHVKTRHDLKTYVAVNGRTATTGATIVNNVAGKVIKIHSYSLDSESDGQTAWFYEETSGNQATQKWLLNAREGVSRPFASAPACLGQTTTLNKKLLIGLGAATFVNYELTYSVDDAT
jgi:hypothetical protein